MLPSNLTVPLSIKQRFDKLYRKLHNLYIAKELTHVEDVKLAISLIHKRIDAIQAQVNANMSMVSGQVASVMQAVGTHSHMVTTAGGPTNQAGTAAPSGVSIALKAPEPSQTQGTEYTTKTMEIEDLNWFLSGPVLAPMGIGTDLDTVLANTASAKDRILEG